ncbi:hypothetical protein SAMN02745181_2351 [Rubritalea squalenifaciens DSM 18772]|uniref:Uncharacterized protein n=2 Tax=Rubritalea squalenifaciens TaxID=407226 RepID=A0A1M6LBP5_9BACT|nr:hypothetical protein SAMN02745181_2351 [Rubritalea squalenifaciens DSM 18772]
MNSFSSYRSGIWRAVLGLSALQCAHANMLWDKLESEHQHNLEGQRESFDDIRDPYRVPPKVKIVLEGPNAWETFDYSWRRNIPVTIFWVGEDASQNNPVHNHASSWDPNWVRNFGGVDDPNRRNGYFPAGFVPRQNPFYIALPYNDVARGGGRHKPEASRVIRWFWRAAKAPGQSVCHNRWIAIHFGKKVCYAQWKDCGPFYTDDYNYVFLGKSPKPNRNGNAGLDISPAVRDFLGVKSGQQVSWKFVEVDQVREGPWSDWLLPQS